MAIFKDLLSPVRATASILDAAAIGSRAIAINAATKAASKAQKRALDSNGVTYLAYILNGGKYVQKN